MVDDVLYDENSKIVNGFQHWFGTAINSSQSVLENLYVEKDADLMCMYNVTQECYRNEGITKIILYRGCTETYGDEKILCSWTKDKKLAYSYLKMERNNVINEVISKEFDVRNILFDTDFCECYFEAIDDVLGMMPCDECIIINKKEI